MRRSQKGVTPVNIAQVKSNVAIGATLEGWRGADGEWVRYGRFTPEEASENLHILNVGHGVISKDAVRTGAQDFTGGLVDLITCANPHDKSKVGTKFALIVKDGKIYVSGLMQRGCCCYLTPTSSRSKETVTEEVIVEYLKNLKQRTLKLSECGENKAAAMEAARVRNRRQHDHKARPPPPAQLPPPYAAQILNEGRGMVPPLVVEVSEVVAIYTPPPPPPPPRTTTTAAEFAAVVRADAADDLGGGGAISVYPKVGSRHILHLCCSV